MPVILTYTERGASEENEEEEINESDISFALHERNGYIFFDIAF